MENIIVRRQEEAGFRPLDDSIIAYRAMGYAKHLVGIGVAPRDFERVYEIAISIYNDTPNVGPFGVDHLVQAAKRFLKKAIDNKVYKKPETKSLVSCISCQGTKIMFNYSEGKVLGVIRNEDGTIKHCEECYENKN